MVDGALENYNSIYDIVFLLVATSNLCEHQSYFYFLHYDYETTLN